MSPSEMGQEMGQDRRQRRKAEDVCMIEVRDTHCEELNQQRNRKKNKLRQEKDDKTDL